MSEEIKKLTADAVNEYFASGKFKKTLDDNIEKAIRESIEGAFGYSGTAKKQIEEAIKTSIKLDFSQIDIPDFNRIIVDFVKHKTLNILEKQSHEILGRELAEMLAPAPETITVQGIVDLFKEECQSDGVDEDCLLVEIDKDQKYGIDLKIWTGAKTKKSYYDSTERKVDPDVDLYINKDKKTISIIRNPEIKKNFGTANFNFDAKIFLMYSAGTKITDILECDPDDVDVNLREND